MRVIADVCDRVTVFNQGQVLVEGDFESVTSDERPRRVPRRRRRARRVAGDAHRGGGGCPGLRGAWHTRRRRDGTDADRRRWRSGAGRRRGRGGRVRGDRGVRRALRPRSPGSARSPTGSRGSSARTLISGYGNHRRRNLDGESGRRDLHLRAERVGEVDAFEDARRSSRRGRAESPTAAPT